MPKFSDAEEPKENLDGQASSEDEDTPKPKKTGLTKKELVIVIVLLVVLILIIGKIIFNHFPFQKLIFGKSGKVSMPIKVLNPANRPIAAPTNGPPGTNGAAPVPPPVSGTSPVAAKTAALPAKPETNASKKVRCKECNGGSAVPHTIEKPYRGSLSDLFKLPKGAAAKNNFAGAAANGAAANNNASAKTAAAKPAAVKPTSVKVVGIAAGYCILKINGSLYYAREGEIINGIEILHIRSKSVRILIDGKSELLGVSQ